VEDFLRGSTFIDGFARRLSDGVRGRAVQMDVFPVSVSLVA
jgi:hypothetical protein